MRRAFISEMDGKQCVVVRGPERPQVYVCVSLEHAQKWLQLMDTAERVRRVSVAQQLSPQPEA
jgi:hypothetical protein